MQRASLRLPVIDGQASGLPDIVVEPVGAIVRHGGVWHGQIATQSAGNAGSSAIHV